MIPIVEDYLTELIQTKLAYLKKNPDQINKVLGTSQNRIDRLANYLKTTPVKVIKGYPRTPAELPCVCIMLQGEEEMMEGLGNKGDEEDVDVRTYTEEIQVTSVEDGIYTAHAQLSHKSLVSVSRIVHNEFRMVLEEDDYEILSSEEGIVRLISPNVEVGDTLTVSYTYREVSVDNLSVIYDANYRLEVWTLNGDLTVELYHILKWAMLSGRDFLAGEKDLFSQRLSGADFQPAPSYFPEFVYRRAVSFWCQFSASTPEETVELPPYIEGVSVNAIPYTDTFSGGEDLWQKMLPKA